MKRPRRVRDLVASLAIASSLMFSLSCSCCMGADKEGVAASAEQTPDLPGKKGLAIIGDAWHCAAPLYQAIVKQMEAKGIQTDVVYDNDAPFDRLGDYDIIVISRYGMNDLYNFENGLFLKGPGGKDNIWVTNDQENELEEYVHNGGSLLMHHDGHCYYNENGAITRLAKATHDGHPGKIEIEVYPTGELPELTAGIEPFTISEEEFRMDIQDSTTVFLKSHSEEHGTANQGWAHEYGKGRVVVLVPGHDTYALQHEMVRKLISNAIDYLND